MVRLTRIALGGVNCYLIESKEGFVLIDTGHPEKRQAVEAAIERAGCRPGDLGLIIITHGDYEHAGNALYLRERFGARIAMRRDEAARLELGDWRTGFKPKPDRFSWIFKEVSRLIQTGEFETFEPEIYLEDGQDLGKYGFEATVFHFSGHTGSSLGILVGGSEQPGFDFAGDLESRHFRLFIDDMTVVRESYERLHDLGVVMVYPGHGKPFRLDSVRTSRPPGGRGVP